MEGISVLSASPLWDPADTRRYPNAGLMLGQRRRRFPNIKPALVCDLRSAPRKHLYSPSSVLSLRSQRDRDLGPGSGIRTRGAEREGVRAEAGDSAGSLPHTALFIVPSISLCPGLQLFSNVCHNLQQQAWCERYLCRHCHCVNIVMSSCQRWWERHHCGRFTIRKDAVLTAF